MKSFLSVLVLVFIFASGASAGEAGLRAALREYLTTNSQWPGAALVLTNVEVLGEGLPKQGFDTYEISKRNRAKSTGKVSFNVALMRRGRTVKTVVIRAQVSFVREVVVALRPIRMRERIGADDVELIKKDVSAIPVRAVFTLADVVGKAAKRPISEGRVVREDFLRRATMVKRGQLLDVRVEGGVIMVRSRATAMSDGFMGSIIKAKAAGGREISGFVSGPGQMVVNLR